VSTWLYEFPTSASNGIRVAIKDNIALAGLATSGGTRSLMDHAVPAPADAQVVTLLRAAGCQIVGRTNMTELGCGGDGVNDDFGTPVNPLDPRRIPGGSSSGNAVALAQGEVDLAIGTDTAGSIRTPAACCGVVGLKPTNGLVPMGGVLPLAPSLDVVGPMARDVNGLRIGMSLLDPSFDPFGIAHDTVTWVSRPKADPTIEERLKTALVRSGLRVRTLTLPTWRDAQVAAEVILYFEMWQTLQTLAADGDLRVSPRIQARFDLGSAIAEATYHRALGQATIWRGLLLAVLSDHGVLAWPALDGIPPLVGSPAPDTRTPNLNVNVAGVPALVMPIPTSSHAFPDALQLVGSAGSEATLCATAATIEESTLSQH
jgi:amidase